MEYCPLGSIRSYLPSDGGLSEEIVADIVSCCLLGLAALHDNLTMHRVWLETDV